MKSALIHLYKRSTSEKGWLPALTILLLLFISSVLLFLVIKGDAGAELLQFDQHFLLFVLVGFAAQLIDGSLGMAYGVSSNTLLLSTGIPPAYASACVHLAQTFTSGASGLAHIKLKHINKKLFKRLVIPGALGAATGAFLLSHIDGNFIRPFVATYLLFMGLLIVKKSLFKTKKQKTRRLAPLASVGGFLTAIGGGGWGPVVVSTLIGKGRTPLYTIGTANLAEFFVSFSASVLFLISLSEFKYFSIAIGLIIGGILAAPLGAYICRLIRPRYIMLAVGIIVAGLSIRTLILTL